MVSKISNDGKVLDVHWRYNSLLGGIGTSYRQETGDLFSGEKAKQAPTRGVSIKRVLARGGISERMMLPGI
jgi:hypothetical protein